MSRRRYDPIDEERPTRDRPPGPYGGKKPIRVSLALYLVSLLVVILAVFIVMMVMYFPGYHTNYKLKHVVRNSDISITVSIPLAETEKRKENPFTKEQRDNLASLFKSMGARSVTVRIEPNSQ
jgi:hypothetical protein